MNRVRQGNSATFETKSSYCRVARQSLPCYTAVARIGFKRCATAVLKSSLVRHVSSTAFETGLRHSICLEISTGTTQKVMLHLLADLIFRKLFFLNGSIV